MKVKVGVYIDGFNLYYGGVSIMGEGVPGWRWLDLRAAFGAIAAANWTGVTSIGARGAEGDCRAPAGGRERDGRARSSRKSSRGSDPRPSRDGLPCRLPQKQTMRHTHRQWMWKTGQQIRKPKIEMQTQ